MNRFGSHPNHENHAIYEGSPPEGISEARRVGSFFEWDFCYMLSNKLIPHGGFNPTAVTPFKRDNPEPVIRHLAQRSALWGTGTASHSLYQDFVFDIIAKS